MEYEHIVDTVAVSMSIDEMPIDIYIYGSYLLFQKGHTMVPTTGWRLSFQFVEPKSEQNIDLSIEVRISGNSSCYLFVGL